MAAKKLEDVVAEGESEEELDPLMKKIKESEDKIKRIKQQNQEKGEDGFSLDKLMIAIIKEFNLSMKEI